MKSNPINKEPTERQRIEIIIKKRDPRDVEGLLIDFFRRDISPMMPIYIRSNVSPKIIGKDLFETRFFDFKIVAVNENRDAGSNELARITIQEYSNILIMFINSENRDNKNWGNITKITQAIISKMQELEFEIVSVKPVELQPIIPISELKESDSISFKPKIPDRPPEESKLDIFKRQSSGENVENNDVNTPTQTIEKVDTHNSKMPKRPKDIRKWQIIYKKIRGWHPQMNIKQISAKLKGDLFLRGYPTSPDTISKILNAGASGLLEEE